MATARAPHPKNCKANQAPQTASYVTIPSTMKELERNSNLFKLKGKKNSRLLLATELPNIDSQMSLTPRTTCYSGCGIGWVGDLIALALAHPNSPVTSSVLQWNRSWVLNTPWGACSAGKARNDVRPESTEGRYGVTLKPGQLNHLIFLASVHRHWYCCDILFQKGSTEIQLHARLDN